VARIDANEVLDAEDLLEAYGASAEALAKVLSGSRAEFWQAEWQRYMTGLKSELQQKPAPKKKAD
jgi:hypothetical protein